ncbi:hypothetical protein QJS10_CPA09g00702 [Acorus calamus]|uniref:Glycolipid transfer protein domain-containing protein n=1 Tax=Acorus calamus TaxID=4465 RepID=A0AAV9E673_ACOCL|nr:hypothetical protein QJS10_CPA09g00702 [Acorus calamus]
MAWQRERPMKNISDAFEGLAFEGEDLDLGQFAGACSLISSFFGILSIFFIVELDYVTKVQDLVEASKTISTVASMIDKDVEKKCVRKPGSHSLDSANEQMKSYIASFGPVIQYIDELFLSRGLGIDW